MTVTIRQVQGDEISQTYYPIIRYSFTNTPQVPEYEINPKYDTAKCTMVVFEDAIAVAGASTIPMTQNLRGKIFPMGAVGALACDPEARRNGYVRQLMTSLFAQMREDGQVISSLYPFRESFYARMGYALFPRFHYVKFPATHIAPLLKMPVKGTIKRMLISDGFEIYRDIIQQIQPNMHGMAVSSPEWAERLPDRNKLWLAAAQVDGEVVGILTYSLKPYGGDMHVEHFFYTTSQGKYLLLQWLARHVDHAGDIWMIMPPTYRLETWVHDLQFSPQIHPFPMSPMGRIITVADIGGMKTGAGQFSAKISDPQCPWNNNAYHFETVDGAIQVSPTTDYDCELTIDGLSTLAFTGGEPEDFALRGWGNPSPEIQATMRAMFPPALPYLHEDF
jgi:predicted acetyltransferase